ncbi:hypothetical protein GCM10011586_27200 [Silvibacterium dinghuense]|nr:hypothetical protein GCM10011586_27200 [Silvibacterium dinghuense]
MEEAPPLLSAPNMREERSLLPEHVKETRCLDEVSEVWAHKSYSVHLFEVCMLKVIHL